jgi:hypothetical protein
VLAAFLARALHCLAGGFVHVLASLAISAPAVTVAVFGESGVRCAVSSRKEEHKLQATEHRRMHVSHTEARVQPFIPPPAHSPAHSL